MNTPIITRVKQLVALRLDASSPTGLLSDEALATAHSLLQVLAGDEGCPQEDCRRFVCESTATEPGRLREYRDALRLLSRASERRHPGRAFAELTMAERDAVLRTLLRTYPHEDAEPRWRRRLRVTSENLDLVFARRGPRRLRQFVVRHLLEHYYTSGAGWAVVGRKDYPGYVRIEREPCQVVAFRIEGAHVWLELSDMTFERLDPSALESDDRHGLAVLTKSGRQRATFSRDAFHAFVELLEEAEGHFLLRVGETVHEVLEGDASS